MKCVTSDKAFQATALGLHVAHVFHLLVCGKFKAKFSLVFIKNRKKIAYVIIL